jgi:hypothetical protein
VADPQGPASGQPEFDAEKAAIVATLESLGFKNVEVGYSRSRRSALISVVRRTNGT